MIEPHVRVNLACQIYRIESGPTNIISRSNLASLHTVTPFSIHSIYLQNMSAPSFWLRCETKQFERRSALTPTTAKKLIDAGFEIFVEKDEQRIFDDSEFEA